MPIAELAAAQLVAYNAADIDAFCACYHDEVVVLDGEVEQLRGLEAFRERYVALFATTGFGARVPQRLAAGPHCVDLEVYWRADGVEREVLVRYTERDGRIGLVQFLR
jgi:hypothetical protein